MNKALGIILLLMPAVLCAEVPYGTKDAAIDENFAYISAQIKKSNLVTANTYGVLAATQTFTGVNTFNNATATTTFSGWVDIGWVSVSSACTTSVSCTATCATGYKTMGGGCDANVDLRSSYQNATQTICATATTASITALVNCARIK